jgi:hypothetical protein
VKLAVWMQFDADVVAWLKMSGKVTRPRANRIPRQRMLDEIRRANAFFVSPFFVSPCFLKLTMVNYKN